MLVARHAGKAFAALATAARSSVSVLWGTRVTRLLVAGSWRSIQEVVFEGRNWLSMKLVVSIGFWICLWLVGYSSAIVAAVVVPAGLRRPGLE